MEDICKEASEGSVEKGQIFGMFVSSRTRMVHGLYHHSLLNSIIIAQKTCPLHILKHPLLSFAWCPTVLGRVQIGSWWGDGIGQERRSVFVRI
jgi:hypothetical protein